MVRRTRLPSPSKRLPTVLSRRSISRPFRVPDDLLVVDQIGVAYRLDDRGQRADQPFLDVRSKLTELNKGFDERGLLSIAFHPKFPDTPKVYAYYSGPLREGAPEGWDHTAHVASFTVKGKTAELASEKVILRVDQPQFNHNSGKLLFGEDGDLFITLGDGGAHSDKGLGHVEGGNAQDIEQWLGKVLRINVNKGDPYVVPEDNPFVGKRGLDEIYAWGVRNPWGVILNPANEMEIILADVGQDRYAEVNLVKKGGNYGWRIREGHEGFSVEDKRALDVDKPKVDSHGNPLLEPKLTYKNRNHPAFQSDPEAKGSSITGGEIYDGKAIPGLKGKYVFGDWSQQWVPGAGRLFVADVGSENWTMRDLPVAGTPDGKLPNVYITAFGKDRHGEVYVLTAGQPGFGATLGAVHKIVPASKG